jgi:hypothetical protein
VESLLEMAKLLVARRGDPVRIEGESGFYGPADPDRELYEMGSHATRSGRERCPATWSGRHPSRPDVRGVARLHILTWCCS